MRGKATGAALPQGSPGTPPVSANPPRPRFRAHVRRVELEARPYGFEPRRQPSQRRAPSTSPRTQREHRQGGTRDDRGRPARRGSPPALAPHVSCTRIFALRAKGRAGSSTLQLCRNSPASVPAVARPAPPAEHPVPPQSSPLRQTWHLHRQFRRTYLAQPATLPEKTSLFLVDFPYFFENPRSILCSKLNEAQTPSMHPLCDFFAFVPPCSNSRASSCDFFAFVPLRKVEQPINSAGQGDYQHLRRSGEGHLRRRLSLVRHVARRGPRKKKLGNKKRLRTSNLVQKRKNHTRFGTETSNPVQKRKNHTQ